MSYQRHPLSAAWPNMQPEEFTALVESIQYHGLRDPIVLLDGQVLDGWHRYTACVEAGMEPAFTQFEGDDPVAYISDKHNRRSLNLTQRMVAIALMNQWAPSGSAGHKSKSAPGAPLTTGDIAKQAGGSVRTASQVKAALTTGRKEVIDGMKDGTLSAKRAAEIAKLPAKDQVKAIDEPAQAAPAANDDKRDELAEAAIAITELAEENETLRAHIAVGQMDAPEVERISAAELIAELRARVKTLEAELDAMRISRDAFQRDNRELMKQVNLNSRELKKLRAA